MTSLRFPACRLLVLLILSAASQAEETSVKVALIGDSTVTDKAGWGKAFADRFGDNVDVRNFAVGGRSAKSWYNEKRLPAVLEFKPDFVLMQFGHNGQPGKGPERETDPDTTYRDFLQVYIDAFRQIGATPILVSSVTRRRFDESGKIASTLTPWAEAAKEVAAEEKVPFIDLHTASINLHNRIGPEESMTFNPKDGDITHFNRKGAEAIADLIGEDLKQACPELAKLAYNSPAARAPAKSAPPPASNPLPPEYRKTP